MSGALSDLSLARARALSLSSRAALKPARLSPRWVNSPAQRPDPNSILTLSPAPFGPRARTCLLTILVLIPPLRVRRHAFGSNLFIAFFSWQILKTEAGINREARIDR